MEKLLIVRHGSCNRDSRLSETGRMEMAELAKFVQTFLNGNPVLILSSSAQRACDSAMVMGDILNVGFEEIEELWCDEGHEGDIKKSYEIIKSRGNDASIVIIVTHISCAVSLANYFLKDLGVKDRFAMVETGEGLQINLEECTVERIPK